jgi:hypothetical protein
LQLAMKNVRYSQSTDGIISGRKNGDGGGFRGSFSRGGLLLQFDWFFPNAPNRMSICFARPGHVCVIIYHDRKSLSSIPLFLSRSVKISNRSFAFFFFSS